MAKQYIQEKIYGNPGQMVTINRSNIISNSIYKPTNKVIKVNGPASANIYAAYITNNTDIPYPDIKGILVYDHIFTYTSNNNVNITNFNLDTWMSSTYGSIYTTTFTYVSSHSGNKWRVNNTSTYVNINNLGISYTMTSGSAPQNGTVVNITADYSKSRYEIWVPSIGNWNVVCVGVAGYSENKIEIVSNTNVYYMDVAIFQAFISVNYTRGAECTITNIENNLTLTADNTEGYYTFTVPYTGIWRIRVEQTFGTGNDAYVKTKYDSVLVSTLNQQITRTVELISNILDDCTWEEIKYVADMHMGDKYWQIGDCKGILLNGPLFSPVKYQSQSSEILVTDTSLTFVNEYVYVYIVAFDHNITGEYKESNGGITFQFCKLDDSNNTTGLCWDMKQYRPSSYYAWNGSDYDSNYNYSFGYNIIQPDLSKGWVNNDIRRVFLGSVSKEPYTDQRVTPPSGYDGTQGYLGYSVMSTLPQDLRNVLKKVKKYSNNNKSWTTDYGWGSSYVVKCSNPNLTVSLSSSTYSSYFSFSTYFKSTFTYVSSNIWRYNNTNYSASSLGISVSGTPQAGDIITIYNTCVDSAITATADYLFLPAAYEVLGEDLMPDLTENNISFNVIDYAEFAAFNSTNQTLIPTGKQVPYEYFNNSSNRIKYKFIGNKEMSNHNTQAYGYSVSSWWVRSVAQSNGYNAYGAITNDNAIHGDYISYWNSSYGHGYGSAGDMLCPCFVVGSEEDSSFFS